MNTKLENRLKMYRMVILVCDKVAPSLQTVPALWNNYQLFKTTVNQYDDIVKKQIRKISGSTIDKKDAREKLISKTLTISGMIKSHADITSDKDLFDTVNYSQSAMRRMRNNILYNVASIVYEYAENNTAILAPFGLTQAALGEFSNTISDFAIKMEEPEESRKMRKAYTATLKEMDLLLRNILANRIDTSIRVIGESDPILLKKYISARNVYDYGIRHAKKGETTYIPAILSGKITDTDGNPITEAIISIETTPISILTDDEGEYLIDTITPGTYIIIISAEGYTETRENTITFTSGDDITRDYTLETIQ